MRRLIAVPLALAFISILILNARTTAQNKEAGDPTELGRLYTTWFYGGDIERLGPHFAPEFIRQVGGLDALRAFHREIVTELGTETKLIDERVEERDGLRAYVRSVEYERAQAPFVVLWAFDEKDRVVGFMIVSEDRLPAQSLAQRAAPTEFLDYETKTPLYLPFYDEWFVFWGGRTIGENYHAVATDQRFAYDFLVLRGGRTYIGSGTSNEHYHCFGLEILAPGRGRVVEAVDGIPDNRPGTMNAAEPLGNHLIIDHGHGEFSFLAHLMEGSVRVGVGDEVGPETVVGACGNSGHSSEPHLHYHLQDSSEFNAGRGLPAQFLDYIADDELVTRGEPTRGQLVRRDDEKGMD